MALADSDFAQGGLRLASYARPTKLFTANSSLVRSASGQLNRAAHERVCEALIALIRPGDANPAALQCATNKRLEELKFTKALPCALTGHVAMRACGPRLSVPKFVEQRLGLDQVQRLEALGERAVDGCEKVEGLLSFAALGQQSREVSSRAEPKR